MAQMHADILARLLPPVAYDTRAAGVAAEIQAAAAVLDDGLDLLVQLLQEMDPRGAYSLLDEWEAAFGLPDLCADAANQTVAERRLAVVAKMTTRGAQTPAYFEALAESLGYPGAEVYEYLPWTCVDTCIDPVCDDTWRYVWALRNLPAQRVTYFTATSPCTEPLANWSAIEALSCFINRLKPAHTLCFFDFGV